MLRRGQELDWDMAATGHYVRLERDEGAGRWLLKRAAHREKDQSYVLWPLDQQQLAHSLFPLGGLSKAEVRQIAAEQGFVNARKGESQDICFVPDGDYAAFIRRYTGRDYPAGPFVDEDGKVLGTHEGIIAYTVGQRRGLGVSSDHGRLYVKQIRLADNTVVLSGNDSLFSAVLEAGGVNLIACGRLDGPVRLSAKVRYRMEEQPCTVWQTGEDTIRVAFDRPQRAVTPGQSVVLYDGETVVGGGVIRRTVGEGGEDHEQREKEKDRPSEWKGGAGDGAHLQTQAHEAPGAGPDRILRGDAGSGGGAAAGGTGGRDDQQRHVYPGPDPGHCRPGGGVQRHRPE